jgi:hypothetical protein
MFLFAQANATTTARSREADDPTGFTREPICALRMTCRAVTDRTCTLFPSRLYLISLQTGLAMGPVVTLYGPGK